MIWFISDTHYHHKNIVSGVSQWTDKSGCRSFDTLDQHDQWLVDMINKMVGRQDTLWHLGDWSFGGKSKVQEFRDRINCERVHIVRGNHDHHIPSHAGLFESVQHYKELTIGKSMVVLMHYPIESWNCMESGSIHLHGHVHGQFLSMDGRYDVGVDSMGLTSMDTVATLPVAKNQRHSSIEGSNKFGS